MLSIVIPTYNASRFMPNLLDSIFSQALDDMEVIIVDDCSSDNTIETVKEYPVRLIQMERNGGPARARNRGVEAARGEVIFFLDADVVVLDGTLREVRNYFAENPSAQCVIGMCATEPLNQGFVPKYMAMFEYIHLLGAPENKVSVFAPRCGAIKKDFFQKIGGYDESYTGADVEDFELARRISREESIVLNPKILVKHQFVNNVEEAVRNYFKRAVMWIQLFMKDRQLDNAGPTSPRNGVSALCAFFSFVSLFFIPFSPIAAGASLILFSIFLFTNMKWLVFMKEEAGLFFASKALLLNYVLGIDIIIASAYGLISYPFSRKEMAGG